MKKIARTACQPWRFIIAIAATLLLAACTPEALPPLRLGINPWPGIEFLYLAQEKGFYRDEGLDLRIVEFAFLSDARRAFERGQIDAMGATMIEVLLARENSTRSPQVVQVVDYSDGADVILARPGIDDGKGLRGKRVGVEMGTLGIYVLARCLELHGLSLNDVQLQGMEQLSMAEAFAKGELDAVVSYPPASVELMRAGKAHTIFSSAQIKGEVVDVIAIDADVGLKRPGDVGKLLRAYHRALDYAGQHRDEAYAIMARHEGITPKEFGDSLTEGIKMLAPSEQADYFKPGGKLDQVIETSARVLRQSGAIKTATKAAGRQIPIINNAFLAPGGKK